MSGHADPIEAVLRQALNLQRLHNAIVRDSTGVLQDLFDEIVAQVARIDPTAPGSLRYRRDRVAKLVARVEDLAGEAFGDWHKGVRSDLARLGRVHGLQVAADLVATLGDAGDVVKAVAPTQAMVKAILDTNPFQGETLAGWTEVQEASTVRRVRQIVQRGMVEEREIGWFVRQIRGGGGARGVWNATRREAEAVVRTAVTEIASHAQMLTYSANPRVVSGVRVVATLDSVTCPICGAMDGKVLDLDAASADLPPYHHQCRCTTVPEIAWKRLGLTPPEEGERFARDAEGELAGKARSKTRTTVPGDTVYEQWLRNQKPAVQDEILGPGRGRLFRERKMRLDRMIATDRRILTLHELERKVA